MQTISVVIITYNEEKMLAQCLESVQQIADEIIIVDSESTDKTTAIAQQFGARVVTQSFLGYGAQKNFANDLATASWILSVDADECLSPHLIQELLAWKKLDQVENIAYRIPRLNQYLGRFMKHGGWYPDAKVRLFKKNVGYWSADQVHEVWVSQVEDGAMGLFKGDLLHYTFLTVKQHLEKIEKYTELAAHSAVCKGKQVGLLKAIIGPKWTFLHRYFIRLGFLDSYEGYLLCKMASFEKWLKYHKIRKYHKDALKLR